MKVYQSKYLEVHFFADWQLIEMIWLPASTDMTTDEYKSESLIFLDFVQQLQPKRILADTRDLFFIIVPDTQEWVNEQILKPSQAIGLMQSATVVSQSIFTLISVEQMLEEPEGLKINNRYFDNREEARQWLLAAATRSFIFV